MDFFSKFTKTEQSKPGSDDNQAPDNTQPGLNSDIFNSAKVVTGAAQSYFTHQPAESNYDNAEVAGAAADLLKAGSDYGKLDETQGVGKYVGQAETYLSEYKTSHTTAATTATKTDTGVDGGDDSIPTSKIKTTEEYSDKVPTYAGGDDVKVGTDPATDEYDQSEGGYEADDGLSKKTSGCGASTEDDASDVKFTGGQSGGGYDEDTEEGFSKKPTPGVGITDASDKYEQKYSQVEDTEEDNYSKKPSGGVTAVDTSDEYDQSGDGYENKNKSEDYSYKSSGGAAAKVDESGEGYDEDTTEGFPKKAAAVAGSYSTTGDDVSEKYSEESEGGGYGNFAKAAAADFLKK